MRTRGRSHFGALGVGTEVHLRRPEQPLAMIRRMRNVSPGTIPIFRAPCRPGTSSSGRGSGSRPARSLARLTANRWKPSRLARGITSACHAVPELAGRGPDHRRERQVPGAAATCGVRPMPRSRPRCSGTRCPCRREVLAARRRRPADRAPSRCGAPPTWPRRRHRRARPPATASASQARQCRKKSPKLPAGRSSKAKIEKSLLQTRRKNAPVAHADDASRRLGDPCVVRHEQNRLGRFPCSRRKSSSTSSPSF